MTRVFENMKKSDMWDELWYNHSNDLQNYPVFEHMMKDVDTTEFLLSVGIGDAKSSKILKSAERVCGVDLSRVALYTAKKNLQNGYIFTQADAGALPFRDESFQTVVCIGTIMFLGDGYKRALQELSRVSSNKVIMNFHHVDDLDQTNYKKREINNATLYDFGHLQLLGFTENQVESLLDELHLKKERLFTMTKGYTDEHNMPKYRKRGISGPDTKVQIYVEASKNY